LVRRRNLTLNIRDNDFESYLLEAAVYVPGDPNPIILWESEDESIATVDQNGLVTAVSPGEVEITASVGTRRHRVDVTVVRLVTNIQLSQNNITLNIHGTNREQKNIIATPEPNTAPNIACNLALTWRSLNPSIAIVNQSGTIEAISPGTTQIIVSSNDGNAGAIIDVTVRSLVTNVQIISRTPMLYVGQTHRFTANILPLNASDRTYRWESSNPNIAQVSNNGTVTGRSRGHVEIRAISTCGDVIGSANLEIRQQVTNLNINPLSRTLETGQRFQISRTITPTNANNQTVRFRSSDPNILHVDGSGIVTALRRGTARIYTTTNCGNIQRHTTVTVIQPVTAVTMCRVAVWLHRGDSPLLLRATIHPEDANIQTIRWSSNNPNAVRVDQNGRISVAQGRKLSNHSYCA
ncbi:MAG: Ig-like domain-containing protein, partial [Oscillospiraceae bacterium]|nr:Ig-like domain-containing protein [Oscillospiraceae bacterium]